MHLHICSCTYYMILLGDEKYDIITMFHVHYYWTTPKERMAVMENVLEHLNPRHGMLFILILDQGEDNQIQLRRATKSKLNFEKSRHYQSVTLLANQLVHREMRKVLINKNHNLIQNHYQISLDFDLSDDAMFVDESNLTSQLISLSLIHI